MRPSLALHYSLARHCRLGPQQRTSQTAAVTPTLQKEVVMLIFCPSCGGVAPHGTPQGLRI
jgi:hypothetical protein